MDVNVPIAILNIRGINQFIDNPTLPEAARRYGIVDVNVVPKFYSLRIGGGIRL